MQITVEIFEAIFPLECDPTDTFYNVKAKIQDLVGIPVHHLFLMCADTYKIGADGRTLSDYCVREGSKIYADINDVFTPASAGPREERPPIKNYARDCGEYIRYYAMLLQSGWGVEHTQMLLELVLNHCQPGHMKEGNLTDEAWLSIQDDINSSMNCNFQIDFLKDLLREYMQLYLLLAKTTPPICNLDHQNGIITFNAYNWKTEYPQLLLLGGNYVPYFDTLERVFLLLDTQGDQSSSNTSQAILVDQCIAPTTTQGDQSSTNTSEAKLVDQCISRLSNFLKGFK